MRNCKMVGCELPVSKRQLFCCRNHKALHHDRKQRNLRHYETKKKDTTVFINAALASWPIPPEG